MQRIKITSIQAPNADAVCRRIGAYLGEKLGIPCEFIDHISWQERERMLDRGEVEIGWICGLPYVWKVEREAPGIELLAAQVMQAKRYQDQPVYYSDVIVRRDSNFSAFMDLRGASWAFNEPHSHSGYNITRYHLAVSGETGKFFSRVLEAGSHQEALKLVLNGEIDASAIDSTVLETEILLQPEICERFRVIATLGPSPIPPWVISTQLPFTVRQAIRGVFLDMHSDPLGSSILKAGQIKRFVQVDDRDYDPIRSMAQIAESVIL
jgi:phosphonate transport system substrate-binding protein